MTYLKQFLTIIFILIATALFAQNGYKDSLRQYIDAYVTQHEVVGDNDKKLMQFFPADESYRVTATFSPVKDGEWFSIPTSSGRTKMYRKYGQLRFKIHEVEQSLYVYQSQALLQNPQLASYLFLPFVDETSGIETYETGRYIDLMISDIENNLISIDFNKAYNPYCAYVSGVYSCPIPPKENRLKIAIRAGEKKYLKVHQN